MPNAAFLGLDPPKNKPTLVDKVLYRGQLPSELYADLVATHTVLARVPHTQLLADQPQNRKQPQVHPVLHALCLFDPVSRDCFNSIGS